MRPGLVTSARVVGDACQTPKCAGHYRELTAVAECDRCGVDVIGLERKEEAPSTRA